KALPAKLTPSEAATVVKVEKYLNSLTTIRSRFIQASSNGAISEGWAYVQRPGRFRFEYDPPVPVVIIADGWWIGYYDLELEQKSHTLVSSTPASLLVGEKISFKKDIIVTAYHQEKDFISLSITSSDEDQEGVLTLTFSKEPFRLRQWSIIDAQGIHTDVTLMKPEFGITLKKELFYQENEVKLIRKFGQKKPS
ncbi:MAG: outer membrane lipoprotein carrier protein LolA, partial [Alphaproteobacteria bacterium]|nr:outer membrane lipoprotein carrier protein LolA [Alphaproteobacteria bacterium]